MKAAQSANGGVRLLDDLDLHWYPEATGGGQRIVGGDNSAAVVAARVQAPRSLWDPTYTETSWITSDYGYGPIRLIPRTKDRIAAHYPGTGIAFTEWNYGGGNHISGAIASADVLGIFGREGVDAATLWEMSADESYTYGAFRAFRNHDGAGGRFGDTSVRATGNDVANGSVYASTVTGVDGKVVVVAINKATSSKTASLRVTNSKALTKADTYRIVAGSPNPVPAGALSPVATNAFKTTLPAMSVTVFVMT